MCLIYKAISTIDRNCVWAFHKADEYRFVSTVSNILLLALKSLAHLADFFRIRPNSDFIKYLKKKTFKECAFLLDPFYGQPYVIKNRPLEAIKEDWREALKKKILTKENCEAFYQRLGDHALTQDADFCANLVALDFKIVMTLSPNVNLEKLVLSLIKETEMKDFFFEMVDWAEKSLFQNQ